MLPDEPEKSADLLVEDQSSALEIIPDPNTPTPDPASWEHIVIALSPQKQELLLKGIDHGQAKAPHISTWPVIGNALSMALLSTPAGLYVQSSMELHRKDFLLFTRTDAARKDGTGGILEIHISQKLTSAAWQGQWQKARPTISRFVRQMLDAPSKTEAKAEDPDKQADIGDTTASAPDI